MLTAFHWIIDRRLAGSGRPGLLADLDEDLGVLDEHGIRTIISLTEARVDSLHRHGHLTNLHFPIPDMGFPTPRVAAVICDAIASSLLAGPVLVHCHAGLGRTGTMVACYLVARGEPPELALRRIRAIDRHYVQTRAQENFIHHFGRFVHERTSP